MSYSHTPGRFEPSSPISLGSDSPTYSPTEADSCSPSQTFKEPGPPSDEHSTFKDSRVFTDKKGKGAIPSVIPANRGGRNLVLCFDGTGDQFDLDVRRFLFSTSNLHPPRISPELRQSILELEYSAVLYNAEEG